MQEKQNQADFIAEQTARQADCGCVQEVTEGEKAAESTAAAKRAPSKNRLRARSVATYIAKIAMMAALSFALSFLEFPIFPATPFLKLDFSSVVPLIGGFALGPVAGVIICFVKELLCLTKSSTGGVGEIANFVVTTVFIIVPTVWYKYRRRFSTVLITLPIGCVLQVGVSLIANRFVNFPLYMGGAAAGFFASVWEFVLAFNAVKSVVMSVLCILLYKKVGWLLRRF